MIEYDMYLVKEVPEIIKVTCKFCTRNGIVNKNCKTCNGDGIHNKVTIFRKVETIKIKKIKRCKKDIYLWKTMKEESRIGELLYYIDDVKFYSERSKKIHFTFDDAQDECNRLNMEIDKIIEIHNKNNNTEGSYYKIPTDYKLGDKFVIYGEYGAEIFTLIKILENSYHQYVLSNPRFTSYQTKIQLDMLNKIGGCY